MVVSNILVEGEICMYMLYFGLMGLIGALLYVFAHSHSYTDLLKYRTIRHVTVGFLSGIVYGILHTEYNFPNSIATVIVGYFGVDIIQVITYRVIRGR